MKYFLFVLLSLFTIIVQAEECKPNLMVFMASWCPYCERLNNEFLIPMERSKDEHFSMITNLQRIDIDEDPKTTKQYNVFTVPTSIFVHPETNKEITRITGLPPEDFFWSFYEEAIETSKKATCH